LGKGKAKIGKTMFQHGIPWGIFAVFHSNLPKAAKRKHKWFAHDNYPFPGTRITSLIFALRRLPDHHHSPL
jgi:hypothetical protein